MEAAAAEEADPPAQGPPPAAFALTVRAITGGVTRLDGVRSAETVGGVTLKLCAETGEEPALTLLVRGKQPLEDRSRTLKEYEIVRDAELHVSPLLPDTALATSLTVAADARVRAAVAACSKPVVFKLRRADGANKHRRWVRLQLDAESMTVTVSWSKNEDFSAAFHW
eukprot:COSAG04_NODE_8876_length_921_cov_2.474453_1_plen_167_part_10